MKADKVDYIHQKTATRLSSRIVHHLLGWPTSFKKVDHHVTLTQYHLLPPFEKKSRVDCKIKY